MIPLNFVKKKKHNKHCFLELISGRSILGNNVQLKIISCRCSQSQAEVYLTVTFHPVFISLYSRIIEVSRLPQQTGVQSWKVLSRHRPHLRIIAISKTINCNKTRSAITNALPLKHYCHNTRIATQHSNTAKAHRKIALANP